MGLTQVEKTAGRWFRASAQAMLEQSWAAAPEAAPTSSYVRFYRHNCEAVKGRTRAVTLDEVKVVSPEIWVTLGDEGELKVISREDAEAVVAGGDPLEFEAVLAGKFEYVWRTGECGHCHLQVLSGEGILNDARPLRGPRQDDLASLSGGLRMFRATPGLKREHT